MGLPLPVYYFCFTLSLGYWLGVISIRQAPRRDVPPDATHLASIEQLTFHANRVARRNRLTIPLTELLHVGDERYHGESPRQITCRNLGHDGRAYRWICEAELVWPLKLRYVIVQCEGYHNDQDQLITAGSCVLRYAIEEHTSSGSGSVEHLRPILASAKITWLSVAISAPGTGAVDASRPNKHITPVNNTTNLYGWSFSEVMAVAISAWSAFVVVSVLMSRPHCQCKQADPVDQPKTQTSSHESGTLHWTSINPNPYGSSSSSSTTTGAKPGEATETTPLLPKQPARRQTRVSRATGTRSHGAYCTGRECAICQMLNSQRTMSPIYTHYQAWCRSAGY